jgi:hypothetical protein
MHDYRLNQIWRWGSGQGKKREQLFQRVALASNPLCTMLSKKKHHLIINIPGKDQKEYKIVMVSQIANALVCGKACQRKKKPARMSNGSQTALKRERMRGQGYDMV